MTVMTRAHEALLERLIQLAGDPLIVQSALRQLNAELEGPPTVEALIRRILELKLAADLTAAQTTAADV